MACEYIQVTNIKIDYSHKTLGVGDSQQITATILPDNASNKTVIWSSSNPNIATVSGTGKVTAKKAGVATITVKTKDGNKTATCIIKVIPAITTDSDADGVPDNKDRYPNTPTGEKVDNEGGILFKGDIFKVKSSSPSCPGTKTGMVKINNTSSFNFTVKLGSQTKILTKKSEVTFDKLAQGNYPIVFTPSSKLGKAVTGYTAVIPAPKMFSAQSVGLNPKTRTVNFKVSGSTTYHLNIGNSSDTVNFPDEEEHTLTIPLNKNKTLIRISPTSECKGSTHEEWIVLKDGVKIKPRITRGQLFIENLTSQQVNIKLIDRKGVTVFSTEEYPINGKCDFDISHLEDKIYYMLLNGDSDEFITFIYKRTL